MKQASAYTTALQHAEWLLQRRDLANAVAALREAEALGAPPDRCGSGRWLAAMLHGDFAAGWRESDAIRKRGLPDPNRFWQGEDIRGKRVILRCLHGLGDAVQFLRYVPLLNAVASHVTVEVAPALLELAPYVRGVEDVITWGEQAPAVAPEWDVQMEIIQLPYVFRTTMRDLPISVNYLRLPPSLLRETAPVPEFAESLRVGVVWGSGEWNPSRSVPLELLKPLTQVHGCEFWNLQGGAAREDWKLLGDAPGLHDGFALSNTVARLAGVIRQLDLVITPDTLAAHLAGAMGTPAWVMLEHAADWRWMQARSDSPWYRSLRLFRQPRAGDWESVVDEVELSLAALARAHSSSQRLRLVA